MKKYIRSFALFFALCLAFNGVALAGDGSNYRQLQETAVFFNNSGTTLTGGAVVILDTAGSGVTAGTTLGSYVDTVQTADSILVVGVVVEGFTSLNQTPVVVVTKGPVDTVVADSSDAVTINTAVGTTPSVILGAAGGGTDLGIALEAGGTTDGEQVIVWVNPTGAN